MKDSNRGKWSAVYDAAAERQPYGDMLTYERAGAWLAGLAVEDWGSGLGWFSRYATGPYKAIDGTDSRFADAVVDLRAYRSDTPGLLMRHVLEHDYGWRDILRNAMASYRQRMVLVIFTPLVDSTRVLVAASDIQVPDIAFRREDLVAEFRGTIGHEESLQTQTQYGVEHVFYVEKTP